MEKEEQVKLKSGKVNWGYVKDTHAYDLVYFHATNLHLDPINSVEYIKGVQHYHKVHLKDQLDDKLNSNRNYATLYYTIYVNFNMVGRALQLTYSGNYAGRSGKYNHNHTVKVPVDKGSDEHKVSKSFEKDEAEYETFEDNHSRAFDSEVAMINGLSEEIQNDLKKRGIPHYKTSGVVDLFTDRATCNSCTAMIMKFQNHWNVKANVKHGAIDDSKGYGGF